MARSLRIKYEGACYHVMNRGAGKENIFHGTKYYKLFLKILSEVHDKYQINIHAYCLMPNHYHVLIDTPLGNLSQAMKYLNGVYVQQYNKLQKTDGPLFRGRFKSVLVDADEHLLTVSRYIHLNPVVAGIVNFPAQYQWSSYAAYIGLRREPWLTVQTILDQFGTQEQIQQYKRFVNSESFLNKMEAGEDLKKTKHASILGSEKFIKTIAEKYLEQRVELSQSIKTHVLPVPTVKKIMEVVANYYNVKIITLQAASRGTVKNKPRAVAIYLSCLLSNQTLQHIANEFTNTSYHGVSKMYCRIKRSLFDSDVLANDIIILRKLLLPELSVVDT